MDHRESNVLRTLAEWDRAIENARKSILASEDLLARVRDVAHSVDERIHRVLEDHEAPK
jgi:hypothetical protein